MSEHHPTADDGTFADVTVRPLIHTEIDHENDDLAFERYRAASQEMTFRSDGDVSNEVLGFALVPPGTTLPNRENALAFVDMVEESALRVDWIRRPV
jgi:hypothetical protein